jgi:hypothetical protein
MRTLFSTLLVFSVAIGCGGSDKQPAPPVAHQSAAAPAPHKSTTKSTAKHSTTTTKQRTQTATRSSKKKPTAPDTTHAQPNPLAHGSP